MKFIYFNILLIKFFYNNSKNNKKLEYKSYIIYIKFIWNIYYNFKIQSQKIYIKIKLLLYYLYNYKWIKTNEESNYYFYNFI